MMGKGSMRFAVRLTLAVLLLCVGLAARSAATTVSAQRSLIPHAMAPEAISVASHASTHFTSASANSGDCNGNSVPDSQETNWNVRDDDGDGVCNGVDVCPFEYNPLAGGVQDASVCAMRAITVPADPANPSAPHVTYSGAIVTLKGIARYGGDQYQWDFGDGSTPTAWIGVSNPYNLALQHVYVGSPASSSPPSSPPLIRKSFRGLNRHLPHRNCGKLKPQRSGSDGRTCPDGGRSRPVVPARPAESRPICRRGAGIQRTVRLLGWEHLLDLCGTGRLRATWQPPCG